MHFLYSYIFKCRYTICFVFVLGIKNQVQGVSVHSETVLGEQSNANQSNQNVLLLTENVQSNIFKKYIFSFNFTVFIYVFVFILGIDNQVQGVFVHSETVLNEQSKMSNNTIQPNQYNLTLTENVQGYITWQ